MKTKIHITRIIAYLVQLMVVIGAYSFLRNHFMLMLLYIVAAAPVLSLIGVFILRKYIDLEVSSPELMTERHSSGYLRLMLTNRSIIPSMDVEIKLDSANTFYRDEGSAVISVPVRARGSFEKLIPVEYDMNGSYRFSVSDIRMRDLLGLVSLRKRFDISTEIAVLPESAGNAPFDTSDMAQGMTESEETVKKGHDFSDVSDVREYIPGDKLMSIHWKLSAKKDSLMVKDRVAMSDQQMVIVTELAGNDEEVDEILSLTYGVCRTFIEEQTYIRLMWWSEASYEFHEMSILNRDDLTEAFTAIYYEMIYKDPGETRRLMMSIHPELKAYVDICFRDGEAAAEVVEQE